MKLITHNTLNVNIYRGQILYSSIRIFDIFSSPNTSDRMGFIITLHPSSSNCYFVEINHQWFSCVTVQYPEMIKMNEVNKYDDVELITEWPITKTENNDMSQSRKESVATANKHDVYLKANHSKHKTTQFIGSECFSKRSKYSKEQESLASTALAKWWKRRQCKQEDLDVVKGCNPNTLIKMISR